VDHRLRAAAVVAFAMLLCAARDARAVGSAKSDSASITAVGNAWLLGAYYHSWSLNPPLMTPPDDGITAGSRTTPSTIPAIRQACAAARNLLVSLAAKQWNADAKTLAVADGKVTREPQDKAGQKGEGTWKLSKEGFCTQWKGNASTCYTIVNVDKNKWSVVKGAATVAVWSKAP